MRLASSAYGNPVTLENCTNLATVDASQKGYAAGIVAYAGAGSTITGCTNEGKISGAGDYVGGILATGTGTTVISRCINSGEIISTGKPGSYNYSVGGIAGSLSSSTVNSAATPARSPARSSVRQVLSVASAAR
ncbi:MAG: hypothetical protein V8T01_00590 [Oscillospiraceae bacterium]